MRNGGQLRREADDHNFPNIMTCDEDFPFVKMVFLLTEDHPTTWLNVACQGFGAAEFPYIAQPCQFVHFVDAVDFRCEIVIPRFHRFRAVGKMVSCHELRFTLMSLDLKTVSVRPALIVVVTSMFTSHDIFKPLRRRLPQRSLERITDVEN